ncbi:tRNA epoxyqueuosine(34) reductase QueG [Inconstantimicrobium mannanitabidum]|uniref:(Fe-S)-binding protein n=1 Tax=Inconstantimicrobium mannanitabidum TaxID=1604901 RepID=A0ACB5REN5_9CLOT|nr:tRNA epoxyqueuosine(34) reductase QueG [Clostridium sp. TW13]GKX67739.1 (Fe-S)-binding protein [Clostridium sp. TW13]
MKQGIINFCSSIGLSEVGFMKCRRFEELRTFYEERKKLNIENEFEEQDIDTRINPMHYMEEGKTIICIAFPYHHNEEYIDNGFSVYTRGTDYHRVVNNYLNKICAYIQEQGGKAIPLVDSNTLPERYIAALCGVGFIGKNNMLINKRYGSYVFLGEIITDLELVDEKEEKHFKAFDGCGECELCYNACPTKAINKNRKNPNICLSYITQKKDIDEKWFKILGGRIFGCDSCQKACLYNQNKEYSNIEEFKQLEFMKNIDEDKMISLNNAEFNSTIKHTSCGWRGKNTIIRNTLIRKAIFKRESIKDIKLNSPNLQRYYNRLLDGSEL